ncbi:DUF421 domain-containing protein [Ammoniphilus resinae]|uniref:Uncharacterized membrane protein YcaP (DUF421 family) n=1 Tax=Ammoniphilus resinae TaxID=861532 RepID=A0ABS4GLT7_9BACL|nr:DUF421 domain-containing protein [Ammoniphilus resinae]MBP1931230.1 uncharacterized membrane protein YcaP (DUF421 family) [Ammoniphilus resinae]
MDKALLELFWEVPVIFLSLLLLTRLQGKKQISHITYFDYITGIIIGDVAAGVLADPHISLGRSMLALGLLSGLTILASYIAEKSRKVRKLTEGEPKIVIKNGKILENNLKKLRLDLDNLRMLLRKKDAFSLAEIEYAVMETDGSLSILKKAEHIPVTPQDLNLKPTKSTPSIELIIDGEIDEEKLKEYGKSKEWLMGTLKDKGIESVEDVSYMEVNQQGDVFIDETNDRTTT